MSDVMVQGIRFSIAGMSVVFVVLILIAMLVAAIRWIDARSREGDLKGPELDRLDLVLITSAVTAALARKARIRSIRRLSSGDGARNPWGFQGRATLHESHVIGSRERK
jgi:hypothetical protein